MTDDFLIHILENRGVLTSRHWLTVFDALASKPNVKKGEGVALDLTKIDWIGHLPLLALCLGVQRLADERYAGISVRMPSSGSVRAFLHRWKFYEYLKHKGIGYEGEVSGEYLESFRHSCVLPIHPFRQAEQTRVVVDNLRDTGTQLYNLLKTAAFLDDDGIRGLAELIIDELCKNVVEHSASADDAFIFGRVSKKDDDVRDVYEKNAAPWETRFLRAVHGEGMTEIVLGDAGNGIVRTLAEQAAEYGKRTPKEILEWAFEPFSTRKRDSDDQTRGLWVVKNKVRDLRGMLYVRTSDNKGGGVSAWWDFLNDPLAEKPQLDHDGTKFLGTQFQILLPHRTEERPRTFISCDRAAAASARKLRPIGFQIPREPPPAGASLGLRDAIGRLSSDEVLFIDMSLMNTAAWERKQLDKLGKTLFESFLLDDVAGGLKTHFRRVWLLNPDDDTLRRLESSNWIRYPCRVSASMRPSGL